MGTVGGAGIDVQLVGEFQAVVDVQRLAGDMFVGAVVLDAAANPVVRCWLNSSAISAWLLATWWLDISGHPGFDVRRLLFDEVLAQQVLCSQQAVFLAGAEVAERGEVFGQGLAGTLDGRRVPGFAAQR